MPSYPPRMANNPIGTKLGAASGMRILSQVLDQDLGRESPSDISHGIFSEPLLDDPSLLLRRRPQGFLALRPLLPLNEILLASSIKLPAPP
jgi:hypothetical protein